MADEAQTTFGCNTKVGPGWKQRCPNRATRMGAAGGFALILCRDHAGSTDEEIEANTVSIEGLTWEAIEMLATESELQLTIP